MKSPYGKSLINQVVSKKKFKQLIKKKNYTINLTTDEYINLVNISCGLYSPLSGFCDYKNYNSIIKKNKINDKVDWTIPILLNYPLNNNFLKNKQFFKLKYNSKIVGAIEGSSIFKVNKKLFNKKVFGTTSRRHPGVILMEKKKDYFIGGKTYLLNSSLPKSNYFFYPKKLRFILKNKKNSNAAFSTRNICHAGHSFIHKYILKRVKQLYIVVIQSVNNKYDPKTLFSTYEIIRKQNKLKEKMKIISIFMPTFFAGPKEAFLQAVMMQNLGFNNFVVGRDHAGVKGFYGKYESQKIFKKFKDLTINIFKTKEPLICSTCSMVGFENNKFCKCKRSSKFLTIDGKSVKNLLINKNFLQVKKYLNPYIFKYLKKNLNKIRKFKGLNYYIK